jgi:hypothetical protein
MRASERPNPADEAGGFRLYAVYIEEQFELQEMRKSSLEARAVGVITTSGALGTIVFGLVSFATEGEPLKLDDAARGATLFALRCFVVAAVFALIVNFPLPYRKPRVKELREVVNTRWTESEAEASEVIANTRLDVLGSTALMNSAKAWCLLFAMAFEVVAVGALARAAWLIL